MLIKYERNEDGTPTGVFVAEKVDAEGTVLVGWAGYNLSGEPQPFTKEEGIRIARARIAKGYSGSVVPRRMRPLIPHFEDRCRRFFKSECVILLGGTTEARDVQ